MIYIVIVVPYTVAFNIASDRAHQPALYAINWTLDVIFFFDILVNFRSTYTSGRGKVVRDQKKIAMHYLKTWFVLDAISVRAPVSVLVCFRFRSVSASVWDS